MTIQELQQSTAFVVNAADIAPILGCDPHAIRILARDNPSALGFPVLCTGAHRVKIPRLPFLKYIGAEA